MMKGVLYLTAVTMALSILALVHNLDHVSNYSVMTWRRLNQPVEHKTEILERNVLILSKQDQDIKAKPSSFKPLPESNKHILGDATLPHKGNTDPGQQTDTGNARPVPIQTKAPVVGSASSDVRKVLLLSYQRSGSTLVGDLLFNRDADTMYSYEPLDALYSSLYGTEPGWNVPADITFTPFGRLRNIPEFELNAVSEYLNNIFRCKWDNLPLEYFIHPFWYSFVNHTKSTGSYTACLRLHDVKHDALSVCQREVAFLCGRRIGDARSRRGVCINELVDHRHGRRVLFTKVRRGMSRNGERYRDVHEPASHQIGSKTPFVAYKQCVEKSTSRNKFCRQLLLPGICSSCKVHAIKTVRCTMSAVEPLFRENPDFFLIHLLRDPRGVVLSRRVSGWSQGLYGRGKVRAIAKTYCQSVANDIKIRKHLEQKFPGRIYNLVLENLFAEPEKHIHNIYDKIGLIAPSNLKELVNSTIRTSVIGKWRTKLTRIELTEIMAECAELYGFIFK